MERIEKRTQRTLASTGKILFLGSNLPILVKPKSGKKVAQPTCLPDLSGSALGTRNRRSAVGDQGLTYTQRVDAGGHTSAEKCDSWIESAPS